MIDLRAPLFTFIGEREGADTVPRGKGKDQVTAPTQQDFFGGSAKSASWDGVPVGYTWRGTIAAEPRFSQQTDFATKAPLTWKDGTPRLQLLVVLQTDVRDPSIMDDDGRRTLYVKGKSLTDAVRDALKAAGAKHLAVGGYLEVTFTGLGPRGDAPQPPKLYTARYTPPAPAGIDWSQGGGQRVETIATSAHASAVPMPAAVVGRMTQTQWDALPAQQQAAIIAAVAPAGSQPITPVADTPPF